MSIIITVVRICELCGEIVGETHEGDMFSDEYIDSDGWQYNNNQLLCPKCADGIGKETDGKNKHID